MSISYHIAKKFTIEKCRNINKIIIDKRCNATYNGLRINTKEVNNMSEEQKKVKKRKKPSKITVSDVALVFSIFTLIFVVINSLAR